MEETTKGNAGMKTNGKIGRWRSVENEKVKKWKREKMKKWKSEKW